MKPRKCIAAPRPGFKGSEASKALWSTCLLLPSVGWTVGPSRSCELIWLEGGVKEQLRSGHCHVTQDHQLPGPAIFKCHSDCSGPWSQGPWGNGPVASVLVLPGPGGPLHHPGFSAHQVSWPLMWGWTGEQDKPLSFPFTVLRQVASACLLMFQTSSLASLRKLRHIPLDTSHKLY